MKGVPEYAVYKGDSLIIIGTEEECAECMGWSNPKQTRYFAYPSYHERVKNSDNAIVAIKLDEEEE